MNNVTMMLKPASSLCNMKCSYCFYRDLADKKPEFPKKIMSEKTLSSILDNTLYAFNTGSTLTFAFQGGEPTLAGIEFFKDFFAKIDARNPKFKINYSLQTNGLIIDEQWAALLKERNVLVGLSLDLLPQVHNANRLDTLNNETFSRILQTKKLFDKFQIRYNILTVLTNQLSRHPKKIWDFLVKENIDYVQFIPCIDTMDHYLGTQKTESSPWALTPKMFFSFYQRLFPLWLSQLEKGRPKSIKLFDDIYNLMINGKVSGCGMAGECSPQIVIESDGTVYPCDFFALDEHAAGNIANSPIEEIYKNLLKSSIYKKTPLPAFCSSCLYARLCAGGCKRTRKAHLDNNFCALKLLFCFFPLMP